MVSLLPRVPVRIGRPLAVGMAARMVFRVRRTRSDSRRLLSRVRTAATEVRGIRGCAGAYVLSVRASIVRDFDIETP